MGCNCGKYQEGGTIEKTRTFNEFEYNKLVDREKKEFFGYWSGYLWDITHKSSPDIVGKFNPKTKILYIFGNSDLNNPLVKWLQDNSKISREEYEKLENGGRLDSETLDLIETLQPLADSGDENAIKLIESLKAKTEKAENKYEFVYSVTAKRDNVSRIIEEVLIDKENTSNSFNLDYEKKYQLIQRGFNKIYLEVNALINGKEISDWYAYKVSFSIHDVNEINKIISDLYFIHSVQTENYSRYMLNKEYLFTENVNESINEIESYLQIRNDRYDVTSYVVRVKNSTISEKKSFSKEDYEPFYYVKTDYKKKLITIFEPNPNNPFDRDDKTVFKEITIKDLNKYTRNQLDLPNAQKRYLYLNKLPVIKDELKDKLSKNIPIGQQLKVYLNQEYQKNYEIIYSRGGSIKGYNHIYYNDKDWNIYYSIEKEDDFYGKRTFDDIVIKDSDGNEINYMELPKEETDLIHQMIERDMYEFAKGGHIKSGDIAQMGTIVITKEYVDEKKMLFSSYNMSNINSYMFRGELKVPIEEAERDMARAKQEIEVVNKRLPFTTWELKLKKGQNKFEFMGDVYEIYTEKRPMDTYGWKKRNWEKTYYGIRKITNNDEKDYFSSEPYSDKKENLVRGLNWNFIKLIYERGEIDFPLPKQYADGGHIGIEVSKCELEDMVGRKLDGWNDDIIYYGGKKYEKCFLRPYYKVK